MNLNRDEFLLLSRTGRGPHSTRAGPPIAERSKHGVTGRLFRKRARSSLLAQPSSVPAPRHVTGPRASGSAGPPRTVRYLDERSYHELEFLVGFPAEEETLR
ncbi:MAG: hypothetical protein ACJ780_24010 [Solirubrobacteraceae bacterium]